MNHDSLTGLLLLYFTKSQEGKHFSPVPILHSSNQKWENLFYEQLQFCAIFLFPFHIENIYHETFVRRLTLLAISSCKKKTEGKEINLNRKRISIRTFLIKLYFIKGLWGEKKKKKKDSLFNQFIYFNL